MLDLCASGWNMGCLVASPCPSEGPYSSIIFNTKACCHHTLFPRISVSFPVCQLLFVSFLCLSEQFWQDSCIRLYPSPLQGGAQLSQVWLVGTGSHGFRRLIFSPSWDTEDSSALRNSAQRLVLPLIDEPQTQTHPLRRKSEFYVRILCQITNVCQIECQMQCENICQNIIARQGSDETPESILVGITRSVQYLDGHRRSQSTGGHAGQFYAAPSASSL